ncbi:hypothetical protein QFC22_000307 [Naganishia vaughanmartiniae]|uniref:Uncharacterized protein n=1 Tax=Naganishia vaughanmartiniae TaxID=1424756 RepID=A0ACC2XMZ0_9TREE|nr:hypothetical protein QFC22_000307 [Naganishia vaughanmartiniae]
MDDGAHTNSSSSMTSLVPRSVVKRKSKPLTSSNVRTSIPKDLPTAFGLVDADDAKSSDSRDDAASSKLSQSYLEFLLSLITVHLTECLISDDFKIKLRTPQGFTNISSLLEQLQTGAIYTPASVATGLSQFPDLYKVRLATAKVLPTGQSMRWVVQPDKASHRNDTQLQGGGYEAQFLDGQRRARIATEEHEQSSIFLDNVPPLYAFGKEGILKLLSEIAPSLIGPNIVLGIGGIASNYKGDTTRSSEGSLPMRHVIIVFGSKANAEFALGAISGHDDQRFGNETLSRLGKLGCVAKTIGQLQDLRLEYLRYQARVQEIMHQSVPYSKDQEEDAPMQPIDQQMYNEETVTAPPDRYPYHCLIFLRNLPDSTNKTEIKAKLDVYLDGDKVDYVDWKKGQITAYVRVLRPGHAIKIIEGLNNEERADAMKAELLLDKQEEIYWMKLPEKIRTAALQVQQ